MLFKLVCFILSGAAILKGLVGLLAHEKLYGWAKKHYNADKWSFTVVILMIYAVSVIGITLYATIFEYVTHGWILTAFMCLASLKLLSLIFNWKETSKKFYNLVKYGGKKLWVLDIIVTILGIVFLLMGVFVY